MYGSIVPPQNFLRGICNIISRKPTAFPLSINLLATHRCNYACQMCVSNQRCEETLNQGPEIDFSSLKAFVLAVKQKKPVIHIGGGEPSLRKDLLEIISFIKQNGLKCLMTTNSFAMNEQVLKKLGASVDVLIVSLYGPRDIHDKLVGREGAFDRTIEHLKVLLKARARSHKVIVSCIALPQSVAGMLPFLGFLERLGVDAVKIEHLNFLKKEELIMNEPLHGHFDLRPTIFRQESDFQEGFVQELLALKKALSRLRLPVFMKPHLLDHQIRDWYLDLPKRDTECRFITHSIFVNFNGDIIPCQFLSHCVLGNIQKDNLDDLWNSERYVKLRKTIKKICPKVCMRCCKN